MNIVKHKGKVTFNKDKGRFSAFADNKNKYKTCNDLQALVLKKRLHLNNLKYFLASGHSSLKTFLEL